jgi:lipopolysaccharide transport system ATP-binding protein
LQIICGTLTPSAGEVETNGRIAALLELGSGFNPEFTGRENVYLNAAVLGLTKAETDARYLDIVKFADIGSFIDQPVKTYSSGMMVRLAFAVIAHVDADILIIDEALAVGDAFFTQKCMRFLRNFMENGTVLFVSHDTAAVLSLCTHAILLKNGEVITSGDPKTVSEVYLGAVYESIQDIESVHQVDVDSPAPVSIESEFSEVRDMREKLFNSSTLRNDIQVFQFNEDASGFGAGGAKITSVQLLDTDGIPLTWVVGGEDVILKIISKAYQSISKPIIGFHIKDRLGQVIFCDNTYLAHENNLVNASTVQELIAKFHFRMPILPSGEYSISPAIAEGTQEDHIQHHWLHDAMILTVQASPACLGLVGIPMKKISLEAS